MPEIRSPHWNEKDGVCEKHLLPQLPCLSCFADQDPAVEVHFTEMDLIVAEAEEIPLSNLLPVGQEWLLKNVV